MYRSVVVILLLAAASLSTAQICRRPPSAGFCRGPSSSVMQELSSAQGLAYRQVMENVNVLSPYDGRSQQGCGGGGCKINAKAAKQRAKTLEPAQAFGVIARDVPEWYLRSLGSGCPNPRLPIMYETVLLQWVAKNGFLGKVSEQGILEVDWKIITVAAGYAKMKPHISAESRTKIEGWISKLYDVTSERQADANNNHLIFHESAMVWSGLVTGRIEQATIHMDAIMKHMSQYITPDGVITTEGRCTKTLHYHAFYIEATMGAIAGYKYHTGKLPDGWAAVAKRVETAVYNINNPKVGAERAASRFGYSGPLKNCRASRMNPVARDSLTRANGLYQAVITRLGEPAPCIADSAYYGNFRFLPFLWKGAKNLPLGQLCCA